MEIKETGVYRLLKSFFVYGGSFSCIFKEGAIIKITQVDKDYRELPPNKIRGLPGSFSIKLF